MFSVVISYLGMYGICLDVNYVNLVNFKVMKTKTKNMIEIGFDEINCKV